jgi:hypothetical protein
LGHLKPSVAYRTEEIDVDNLMINVMAIADEVDSQLAQAMASYMTEANRDAQTIEA